MREWDKLEREDISPHVAVERIQEPEARTLPQLYAPWGEPVPSPLDKPVDPDNIVAQDLLLVWRGCSPGIQQGAQLHEEQERQVSHEVEREQQIYRPPGMPPAPHTVSEDVRYFASHGKFPGNRSSAVRPAFEIFRWTSAGKFDVPTSLAPDLYVTEDFFRTVEGGEDTSNDEFLKPAHWVLSNSYNSKLLLLSQYETNELVQEIQDSEKTKLHIYAPRSTKSMRSFEQLDFITIGASYTSHRRPQDTAHDLGLFAGSLYFETFSIYESFRHFLGLVTEKYNDIPEVQVTNEGFVDVETRRAVGWPIESPFRSCPLPFLSAILDIRRKSLGYLQTHVGAIVEAMPLTVKHF
jgi:hypothetical protein